MEECESRLSVGKQGVHNCEESLGLLACSCKVVFLCATALVVFELLGLAALALFLSAAVGSSSPFLGDVDDFGCVFSNAMLLSCRGRVGI